MRRRKIESNEVPRLLGMRELRAYLGLGENMARQFGKESGALVKIGRRALYDRKKLDEYIDSLKA